MTCAGIRGAGIVHASHATVTWPARSRRKHPLRAAFVAGEVAEGAHFRETCRGEQRAHGLALRGAVLEDEPASREQAGRRAGDHRVQRLETGRPRIQRPMGLVTPHLPGETGIAVGNVRRIACDHVEQLFARGLVPRARFESSVCNAEPLGIRGRKRNRRARHVRPQHPARRTLARDGECDRAAAGREVEHAPCAAVGQVRERALDHELGLRARHQHVARHRERHRPEFLLAQDVGDRLSARAPRDVRFVPVGGVAVEDPLLGVREQPGAAAAERGREQQLGLAAGVVRGAAQPRGAFLDERSDLGRHWILSRAVRAAQPAIPAAAARSAPRARRP